MNRQNTKTLLTALHLAVKHDDPKKEDTPHRTIIRMLLDHPRINTEAKDKEGFTARGHAEANANQFVLSMLNGNTRESDSTEQLIQSNDALIQRNADMIKPSHIKQVEELFKSIIFYLEVWRSSGKDQSDLQVKTPNPRKKFQVLRKHFPR